MPDTASRPVSAGPLLDELLPAYDVHEVHAVLVDAPPARVFAALRRMTSGEMPVLRILMGLRGLPARLTGRRAPWSDTDRPLLDQILAGGFSHLGEEGNRELVVGFVGQPWKLTGGRLAPVRDGNSFTACETPGYVKVAMNFHLQPIGHRTRLVTETRIRATDPASRRAFGRYWWLIRPGSGLIRRAWLRAIKRRAETATAG